MSSDGQRPSGRRADPRLAVYAARRAAFLREMVGGIALLRSAPVLERGGAASTAYRQDSDFYYLTGWEDPHSACLLTPGHPEHRFVLFVAARDPEREVWDGPRPGLEEAAALSGADAVFPIGQLPEVLPSYLDGAATLYLRLGEDSGFDQWLLAFLRRYQSHPRHEIDGPAAFIDPGRLLGELRLVKSAAELALIRRAADITVEGHLLAMSVARPGMVEYQVQAAVEHVFRRLGAVRTAFQTIVGAGPNATVLHYVANRRRIGDGELLLVDAGAEYRHYAADVTRTFPVGGRFSTPQREIYEVVLAAQEAALAEVAPGATLERLQERAIQVMAEGLARLGVLSGEVPETVQTEACKSFYMHGIGHWLGLDIRDPGRYRLEGRPRPFQAGMVLTVEPGLYFSTSPAGPGGPAGPAAVASPPRYRGIGVRIEDMVLVTDSGCEVLTARLPRTVAEIEGLLAGRASDGAMIAGSAGRASRRSRSHVAPDQGGARQGGGEGEAGGGHHGDPEGI